MLEQLYQHVDARPGPFSQTTADCLSAPIPVGEEYLVIDKPTLHADSLLIQPSRKRTWDEVVDKILTERADAWQRLAEL